MRLTDLGEHLTIRQYYELLFNIVNTLGFKETGIMTPTAVATTETDALINPISTTPAGFDASRDLPAGFMDFFLPLHRRFTPRQQELARKRVEVLQRSLEGEK